MALPPRLRPMYRRARALTQTILGPSSPTSPLPLPQASCSVSVTAGRRSHSTKLDGLSSRFVFPSGLYPFLVIWLTIVILLIRQQYYLPSSPSMISCTASPWDDWPPDTCGVNGTDCVEDLTGIDGKEFRCMGGCKETTLGNPRWIGDEKVDRVPLIVGGGDGQRTYRADSWVCASAIHSSLISPTLGGCVTFHALPYRFGFSDFVSSDSHGLQSTAFQPFYPGAFRLSSLPSTGCLDIHYIMTGFNAFCLSITTVLLRPPQPLLFTILLVMGYFQIVLFSDAPSYPPNWEQIFARLVPVLVTGYWAWKISFRTTMQGFKDLALEQAFWQGAGYWIGIESSTIFARLPISRLGYDALDPAGVTALTIIVVIVVIIALVQAWEMRKLGFLRYYLIRYLPLVPILIILAFIPGYTLRVHHYLLALIAIPVLSLPNRISLFFQAFMLGLFLDGVGRWGWAGIIEQTASLLGDANAGTLVPIFFANTTSSDLLQFSPIADIDKVYNVSSYSMLIDDIQYFSNYPNDTLDLSSLYLAEGVNHYFRLAYIANGSSLDFSDPVTRWSNGSWGDYGFG
ncbi:hypothetical protein IAR55_004641 [Kwoniella newhampshirensis]|uniref:LCCL domain-containing protein n=1 Tax=Kwoniella newhampshirensis TaxID=1651941 RepID=A0AAW0YQ02_9TREE